MKYLSVNDIGIAVNKYIEEEYDYFIAGVNKGDVIERLFLDKKDYSVVKKIDFERSAFYFLPDEIVATNLKDGYKTLSLKDFQLSSFSESLVPRYKWSNSTSYIDLTDKSLIIKNEDLEILKFKDQHPVQNKFCEEGIIKYLVHEQNKSWVKLISPDSGDVQWELQFEWKIVRLNIYKNVIVLEYHAFENLREDKEHVGEVHWANPNVYTIVIDAATGKELWRRQIQYSLIDRNNELILASNEEAIFEYNIWTGDLVTKVVYQHHKHLGYYPHFTDKHGIYYTGHDGEFGRINRYGNIDWEFILLDQQNERRILSEWLLLGNGKLVLQAKSNHPNGDLICIFNPEENLEYSKVHWQ